MAVIKPYKFIESGAMAVTKPSKFIGFGAMDVTKPYKFIGFAPERERLLAAAGRALAILNRWAEIPEAHLRPKWIPSRVFYVGPLLNGSKPPRPLLLVSLPSVGGLRQWP